MNFLEWSNSVLAEMSPDVLGISGLYMNMISVESQPGEKVSPRKLKPEGRDLKLVSHLRFFCVL